MMKCFMQIYSHTDGMKLIDIETVKMPGCIHGSNKTGKILLIYCNVSVLKLNNCSSLAAFLELGLVSIVNPYTKSE